MLCNEVVFLFLAVATFYWRELTGLRVLHGVGVVCHRLDSTCIFLLLKKHF